MENTSTSDSRPHSSSASPKKSKKNALEDTMSANNRKDIDEKTSSSSGSSSESESTTERAPKRSSSSKKEKASTTKGDSSLHADRKKSNKGKESKSPSLESSSSSVSRNGDAVAQQPSSQAKPDKASKKTEEIVITLEIFHPHAKEEILVVGDLSGGWEKGKRMEKHESIEGMYTRVFKGLTDKIYHYRFVCGKTYILHPYKPQTRIPSVGLVNYFCRSYSPSYIFAEYSLPSHVTLQVAKGDLTEENCDAIVNAANKNLTHGNGLARMILDRGGSVIDKEGQKWLKDNGGLQPGGCALTTGGELPCKFILHAVGPRWGGNFFGPYDKDAALTLRSCVQAALKLAEENPTITSVAIPSISSGIFGGDKENCARIIVDATIEYLSKNASRTKLKLIRFANIDAESTDKFLAELQWRFQKSYLPL